MDYTDSSTVARWLEELYDEAFAPLPSEEKSVRCEALAAFLDSALQGGEESTGGDWWHLDLVQIWASRALLSNDPALRTTVWKWVESMIEQLEGNRLQQTEFAEGLFDYLIGSPPSWGAQAECDWGDPGWSFAVDKILRALGDERSRWVAFLAFDGDLDRLHDTLHAYLDRELSHGYAGPVSKAALALHLNRWQRGLTPS